MRNDKNQKRLKDLEKRRQNGIRLLKKGYTCYGVAKELGVSKQSVMRWRERYEKEGLEGVKWKGISGRASKLTLEQKKN
ncbi:putative terminase, ATPase subunit, gpP-like protein [Leptospira borgpetersenii str. Noumea 25]|nr:putative terminase, ATPase subunit, gpP-like protein [Leptospira borgpetersenii str. Noumea 25]